MSKKIRRVPVILDAGNVTDIPDNEIKMIMRGADEMISVAGRSMLVKLLKGSKDKKILELGLDKCPAYGFYKNFKAEEVSNRVDWCIKHDYLRIIYAYRLPVIIFSPKGWEIEKETYAQELYGRLVKDIKLKNKKTVKEMEKVHRDVKFRIAEIAGEQAPIEMVEILDLWKSKEVKKIASVINKAEEEIISRNNIQAET